jgi:hypothetical protein
MVAEECEKRQFLSKKNWTYKKVKTNIFLVNTTHLRAGAVTWIYSFVELELTRNIYGSATLERSCKIVETVSECS